MDTNYRLSGNGIKWNITRNLDTNQTVLFLYDAPAHNHIKLSLPSTVYKKQENPLRANRAWAALWKSAQAPIMTEVLESLEPLTIYSEGYMSNIAWFIAEDYHYRTGKKASLVCYRPCHMCFWGDETYTYLRSCVENVTIWRYATQRSKTVYEVKID